MAGLYHIQEIPITNKDSKDPKINPINPHIKDPIDPSNFPTNGNQYSREYMGDNISQIDMHNKIQPNTL